MLRPQKKLFTNTTTKTGLRVLCFGTREIRPAIFAFAILQKPLRVRQGVALIDSSSKQMSNKIFQES